MKQKNLFIILLIFSLFSVTQSWAQNMMENVRRAEEERRAAGLTMGTANVLLLPVVGGTAEENKTLGILIANLRDINDACNLIDQTAAASILPANFTGYSEADSNLMYNLAIQHRANFVIHSNVQKFAQRNLAILSRYDVFSKKTDYSYYLEYCDPVEAWVKLPGVLSALMKKSSGDIYVDSTGMSANTNFWVRYQSGVNRAFAERMIMLLAGDYVTANGKSVVNITSEMEASLARKQGVTNLAREEAVGKLRPLLPNNDWNSYLDKVVIPEAIKRKGFDYWVHNDGVTFTGSSAIRTLLDDTPFPRSNLTTVVVSKQGNKTRFHVLKGSFTYIDVTDERDFIRQMRGLSLSWGSGKQTAGYDLGIDRNVKYNYWKYAGEDSTIPDIVTYTSQFQTPKGITVSNRGDTEIYFNTPRSVISTFLIYYSTEDDFSKAQPASSWRVPDVSSSTATYVVRYLKPDTRYYFWVTSCYGYLLWLQSKPTESIMVRTKPE